MESYIVDLEAVEIPQRDDLVNKLVGLVSWNMKFLNINRIAR